MKPLPDIIAELRATANRCTQHVADLDGYGHLAARCARGDLEQVRADLDEIATRLGNAKGNIPELTDARAVVYPCFGAILALLIFGLLVIGLRSRCLAASEAPFLVPVVRTGFQFVLPAREAVEMQDLLRIGHRGISIDRGHGIAGCNGSSGTRELVGFAPTLMATPPPGGGRIADARSSVSFPISRQCAYADSNLSSDAGSILDTQSGLIKNVADKAVLGVIAAFVVYKLLRFVRSLL